MDTINHFRSLDLDWQHLGRSVEARMAARRWRASEPSLAGFDSPADVVAACQRRGDPRSTNDLLGALLRLAADCAVARRALLQAVLPTLADRARRRRPDAGVVWDGVEEQCAELVALTLERIAEVAGTSPEWPSHAIVGPAFARFRWASQMARRRVPTVVLEAAHHVAAPVDSAAELGAVLTAAVRSGGLRRADAALIWATRVLGVTPAEVAERERRDVRAVRVQRARAERTLVALAG